MVDWHAEEPHKRVFLIIICSNIQMYMNAIVHREVYKDFRQGLSPFMFV